MGLKRRYAAQVLPVGASGPARCDRKVCL